MKRLLLLSIVTGLVTILNGQSTNHWETAVFNNDTWRYFPGISEPDATWRSLAFNDNFWASGLGGFGYGDSDDNTVIPASASVYMRIKFSVSDTAAIAEALLSIDYDDAFVAYLNDTEIARSGISPVNPAFNQFGTDHEAVMYQGGLPESFPIRKSLLKNCLHQGENVLAIQVHNSSATSSDMSSNAFLSFGINNTSVYFRPVPGWFSIPGLFTSSALPIVIISTDQGKNILNDAKIQADMKIIWHGQGQRNFITDSGNVYNGKIGIEIRGAYSASLPQKPYGFETRDSLGENRNVSLLGMPAENDWVLLANYNDKTFLRNVLAFDIFRKMGNYSTRSRYCEVVINNEYQGIYLLGEKIKQDKERVNIASLKPKDTSGDDLTGGYIFKNDYYSESDNWTSQFPPWNKPGAIVHFVYYDPDPDDITIEQKAYIKEFINSVETVLYNSSFNSPVFGYKAYIDIKSFADYFILSEVTRNVDAYKKSRFFFKDKDSKNLLLHSGPPWDYDWAWKNLTENCIHFNKTDGSGWAYKINECNPNPVPPSWEVRMLKDGEFASLVHDRYFDLRSTILSQSQIDRTIDSVAKLLDEAQVRHYQKWKILGINVGTPEPDYQPGTYEGEITKFKYWISSRLAWLDANIPGIEVSVKPTEATDIRCRIFPNPVEEMVYIESDREIEGYYIISISGQVVKERSGLCSLTIHDDLSLLKPGLYLVRITLVNGSTVVTMVIKK